MEFEREIPKILIPCENCEYPMNDNIYKITEITLTEFGKKPIAIVSRICKVCFYEKYPEHKETPENQINLFNE